MPAQEALASASVRSTAAISGSDACRVRMRTARIGAPIRGARPTPIRLAGADRSSNRLWRDCAGPSQPVTRIAKRPLAAALSGHAIHPGDQRCAALASTHLQFAVLILKVVVRGHHL